METLGEILGPGETKVASSDVKSMGNNSGSKSLTTIIRDIKRDFSSARTANWWREGCLLTFQEYL